MKRTTTLDRLRSSTAPLGGWFVLMILLLLSPGGEVPHLGGAAIDELIAVGAHCFLFCGLAFLALARYGSDRLFPVVAVCLALSVILELLQVVVPERSVQLHDVAANATGIVLGLLLAHRIVAK